MKILVLYDSQYGNTKDIAVAINSVFVPPNQSTVLTVNEASVSDLKGLDLLIVGSPTQGGRPTQKLQTFFDQIPSGALRDVKIAVFDTRFLEKDLNLALRLLIKTIGYAAPKMAETLKNKGGEIIVPPEGFIVKGKEGPLAPGELVRAKEWAQGLDISSVQE